MSAASKSGGSSECCECGDCYQTNSKGTKKNGTRSGGDTGQHPGTPDGSDCCNFDMSDEDGIGDGAGGGDNSGSGGNGPCFKAQNSPDGVKLTNPNGLKNRLKNKIRSKCPSMSNDDLDNLVNTAVEDLTAKAAELADQSSVPTSSTNPTTGQSGPCNFTMCLDSFGLDPNTGTTSGTGANDGACQTNDCNSNGPSQYCNPNSPFPNPGPIPPDRL